MADNISYNARLLHIHINFTPHQIVPIEDGKFITDVVPVHISQDCTEAEWKNYMDQFNNVTRKFNWKIVGGGVLATALVCPFVGEVMTVAGIGLSLTGLATLVDWHMSYSKQLENMVAHVNRTIKNKPFQFRTEAGKLFLITK